jgi:hypothetical protein
MSTNTDYKSPNFTIEVIDEAIGDTFWRSEATGLCRIIKNIVRAKLAKTAHYPSETHCREVSHSIITDMQHFYNLTHATPVTKGQFWWRPIGGVRPRYDAELWYKPRREFLKLWKEKLLKHTPNDHHPQSPQSP